MHFAFFLAFLGSLAAGVVAQTEEDEFWWSYQGNYTDEGYDPDFEVCGSSCSECAEGARKCFADEFSNICYEPLLGETCCQDVYGTACYEGYYCAYNDEAIAFCCGNETSTEDCGALFEEELTSTQREPPSTVTVTQVFRPTGTESVAHRPNRTPLSRLPLSGGKNSTSNDNEPPKPRQGLTTGGIIGLSIGAAVVLLAIVALVRWLMHRASKNKKYNQIGSNGANPSGNAFNPAQSFAPPAASQPGFAGPPAYEPMRGSEQAPGAYMDPQEYKQPLMGSPQPPTMAPYYHDNPSAFGGGHTQGVELRNMTPQMQELPAGKQ